MLRPRRSFLARRPGTSTPVAGLYLAGASTRSGHGIIGAMLSGVTAADAILATRMGVREVRALP